VAWRLWRKLWVVREGRVRLVFMPLTKAIGLTGCTEPKLLRRQFATALREGRIAPLSCDEQMGHVTAGARAAEHGPGLTAVYTHTRPREHRRQLGGSLVSLRLPPPAPRADA
jgi:integrase